MAPRIETAPLALDASGTPYSARYRDVYHSRSGGLDQAREVFLAGNGLPARWAHRPHFTILETGFGLGTNFLATWAAWREDHQRPRRLHFVSIEHSPFAATDLLAWHARDPCCAILADELANAWPVATPGLHRIELDERRVVLTLAFGEAGSIIANLRIRVDAFYFDGFTPPRNPDAWSAKVFRGAARLAAPGATFSTYTVARTVADGLSTAGFTVRKAPGLAPKRDKLLGEFAPRYRVRRYEPPVAACWPDQTAMVIGAGIAGVCVAERLAVRGWQVRILERRAGFARAGSGAPAAALHPIIARDDSLPARLTRAGFLHMWRTLAEYPAAKQAAWLGRCGHLLCARTDAAEALAPAIVQDLGFPRSFVTAIDAGQACDAAGVRTARGGYWFPDAGWIRPAPYCETVLARRPDRVSLGLGQAVARLQRGADGWLAMDEQGRVLARSSVVVVAAGTDLSALADLSPAQGGCAEHHRGAGSIPLPLRRVRGQLTSVPARACQPPRVIVGGDGCCLPAVDGRMWFGATYDPDEPDERPRAQDDDRNLQRLAHLLPDNDLHALHPLCSGHVGFRAVAPDRLPLAGALPDVASPSAAAAGAHGVHPVELPRVRGVFMSGGMASRGLAWAAIMGETVASLIEGEPPPIEADLLDAVDPGRFLVKLLRNAKRY